MSLFGTKEEPSQRPASTETPTIRRIDEALANGNKQTALEIAQDQLRRITQEVQNGK